LLWIRNETEVFPAKIVRAISDTEERVSYKCKGFAPFEIPVNFGELELKRDSSGKKAVDAFRYFFLTTMLNRLQSKI
jgi:hypothetical protein